MKTIAQWSQAHSNILFSSHLASHLVKLGVTTLAADLLWHSRSPGGGARSLSALISLDVQELDRIVGLGLVSWQADPPA